MTTRKPVSWFITEKGRNFSFAIVTGTGIALSCARFLPQTFFLENYKEFVHYYKDGQQVGIAKELSSRYDKCLEILKLTDTHRKLIQPFSVFGFDLFHAGSTSSRFGVAIGIPVNFAYTSIDDIKKDSIQVNQKNINWESEVGKKLANALILPDKVQEFAICREILMTNNNKVVYESCYPFMSIFFVYNLCQYLNKKLNLYAAHPVVRTTMYSIVGLFGIGTYFLMKDLTEVHYETNVDQKLCELDPEYVESGVIFYEKLLQRNQALRELMGREGERKYTKMGNENYGIRQPHVALIHRKQFFEEKLKEKAAPEDLEKPEE
ncbi:PREDICTED: transmembrane protein 177 [Papilio xuthus]|uniref:Transmembrane protein 177 n=1 Tax=Papilio xuthus TaxID=66420 RepID=A0A194PH42_PAPXU|nr:PREDICTED: transmembrane protein 177 [Papilio xuthus]KPI92721.1 Transmembrane protein 177 [Papilio xuthus]